MPDPFVVTAGPIRGTDEPIKNNEFGDDAVTFKFKRLDRYEPGVGWILLYYGASGSGKTYFAGTAGGRTLFVNSGDGMETLLSPAFTSRYPEAKQMIVVDVREYNPKSTEQAFDIVTKAVNHALNNFADQFDNIVMDEATAFRRFAINKAMQLNTAMRVNQSGRGDRLKEFAKPDIGDYGTEMQMIEWFLGQYIPLFKERGKNFIMLAHERQIYGKPAKIGDEAPLKRVVPGFTGKTFPDVVPAYFDDVWRAEVIGSGTNKVYRARTAGSTIELGKSRHGGVFGTVEPDPNFLKLLAKIRRS